MVLVFPAVKENWRWLSSQQWLGLVWWLSLSFICSSSLLSLFDLSLYSLTWGKSTSCFIKKLPQCVFISSHSFVPQTMIITGFLSILFKSPSFLFFFSAFLKVSRIQPDSCTPALCQRVLGSKDPELWFKAACPCSSTAPLFLALTCLYLL